MSEADRICFIRFGSMVRVYNAALRRDSSELLRTFKTSWESNLLRLVYDRCTNDVFSSWNSVDLAGFSNEPFGWDSFLPLYSL